MDVPVVKYDRNGFRPCFRQLIYIGTAGYLVKEAKIKQRVEFNNLKGVSVSNLSDNFLILHVQCEDIKQKGGLVLQCDYLFEALTKLSAGQQAALYKVVQGSVKFDIQPGREGLLTSRVARRPMIYRAKNGHLMVVSMKLKDCGHSILK
ncbi:unconventional myosin-Ic-like [Salvelinus fontinalis]|uniref:unconventional myosin-Ic-like n=1 Tax=Salvelinus fontinalis TaxID=8038 RepID=UPI0024860313|nr:unconventional myosin-Ic-like [Salvelinus fontinalis]